MALNAPTLTSTSTPGLLQRGLDAWALLTQALNALQPLVALAARVYVADRKSVV